MNFVAIAVAGLVVLVTMRRLVFTLAAMVRPRASERSSELTVAVLVALRNEEKLLPRLLAHLDQLEYPVERMRLLLVNDGSTDTSGLVIDNWAGGRAAAQAAAEVIHLPIALGKAGALRAAAARAGKPDFYVVFDADCSPASGAVAALAGAFTDSTVGAVGGYPKPHNAAASWVARYAALERWVYHLVTLAGKDRLGLAPPVSGAVAAYRRTALEDIGGFPADRVAEDIEISVALQHKGWTTRWIRNAEVREDVVSTLVAFWRQRQRWSRTLLEAAPRVKGLEGLLVSAGYLDRLVVLAAIALAGTGHLSGWWVVCFASAPTVNILVACMRAGARNPLPFLVVLAPMFAVDLAATITAACRQVFSARQQWNPERDRTGATGEAQEGEA